MRLLALLALFLAGCGIQEIRVVGASVWHDDKRGVTCWVVEQAISCLPDRSFMPSKGEP